MKQIMVDPLSNAIKFSQPSGHIDVAAKRDDSSQLRISVADHGEGMDSSTIASSFEPFRQGDHQVSVSSE